MALYLGEHKVASGGENKLYITTGTEFLTGRIIDGKEEYGKRINCGTLPNASSVSISTGLTNVNYMDFKGIAISTSGSTAYPYQMTTGALSTSTDSLIYLLLENNIFKIRTTGDVSAYTGYVEVYYTKN